MRPMRFLAFFLACYLTLLGCWPCADAEPCAEAARTAVVSAAHSGCGTSHGGVDWCSPMCQCPCCAGFALPTATAVRFVAPLPAPRLALRFAAAAAPAAPVRAPATPWQPPQPRA